MKLTHAAAVAALAVLGTTTPATAQTPKQTAAMKLAKAGETWGQILADRKALDQVIREGKLSEAHDLAFSIRDGVVTLPYKSDALPAAKKAALAKQVQAVAGIATEIDRYADAGDAAKTKAQYARLVKALAGIEALYPANTLPTEGARPMSASERELFLTPGGAYTAEDIKANGNTSVFQKFPGYVPSHNTEVKAGELVCPISATKPDEKLSWVVGGKTYQFCCPPCIAEFVQKAKKSPAAVKAPESYVKK